MFDPMPSFIGTAGIEIVTDDQGHSGAGGPLSDTDTIDILVENDAPVLDNTGDMTLTPVAEDVPDGSNPGDQVLAIIASAGGNRITDVNVGAVEGIAVIAADVANGTWQYSTDGGNTWTAFGLVAGNSATVLSATVDDSIRFVPDPDYYGTAAITFRAWDTTNGSSSGDTGVDATTNGGTTAFSTATETAVITVNSVNDAPVLDNTGTPSFLSITEDQTANAGELVSAIVASAGGNPITDTDAGALEGIAVTGLASGNGTWQYSTNGGGSWSSVGSVSATSALLLRPADRIRFVPDGMNGTAASITYRAWDQAAGSAGNKVDTSTNGGTTPFSIAGETAAITVTDVNDAPVLDDSGTMLLTSILPNDTDSAGDTVSAIVASAGGNRITDVDNGAVEGIAVTGLDTANGSWQYSTNGGAGWTAFGAVADASATILSSTDLVRFVPSVDYWGSATVTFRAWDTTDGSAGGDTGVDASTTGGATAFSTATETATLWVNSAPVLDDSGTPGLQSITEDQTANAGDLVSAIVASAGGDPITDTDAGALEGIAITGLANGNGMWQYSTNGGGSWSSIGSVSDASALLLRPADRVRFRPDAMNGTAASISYRAWDQTSGSAGSKVDTGTNGGTTPFSAATETAAITVTDVNDAPVLNNSGTMLLTRVLTNDTDSAGDTVAAIVASAGGNRITDVDIGAVEGIAVTALDTANGSWQFSTTGGAGWTAFGAVADVSATVLASTDLVRFVPDADYWGTATITFRAWDTSDGSSGGDTGVDASANGGTTALSTASETATLWVNSAPVLDDSGTPGFPTITEDQTANAGEQVSAIVASAGGDPITDVDAGALEGMAITALASGNGTWQYSTNGGGSWSSIGSVSDASALLLRPDDRVRFVPDGMNGTTASIDYRAWDQTSGSVGTKVDTSTNGGTTPFSVAIESAAITVTDVNDAPVLDSSGTMTLTAIDEDDTTNSGDLISAIIASAGGNRITDVDNGAVEGIAVTGLDTANGSWQFSTNGGTGWTAFGAVADNSATVLADTANDRIRFVPNLNYNGSATITFRAWDTSDGSAGGQTGVDAATNGATTAFSTGIETASVTVNPVNDAPVVDDQGFGVNENTANGTAVGTVVASDVDAGDSLTYAITAGNTGGAFAVHGSTGQITVANTAALDFETNPTFTLTVQVTDDGTPILNDTATVTLTLADVNESPVVDDQGFGINENTANGTIVGTVVASDVDAGDSLAYAITAGNTGGAFAINSSTGQITVANATALDFETNPAFALTVQVTDDGTPILNDTATVTLTLADVNENPVVDDQGFGMNENSANGTVVGTVVASDPDAGDSLTYAITAGNTSGAFAINGSTGQITVANTAALDFETNPSFSLTVRASDGTLSDTATVSLTLADVNDSPVVDDQGFGVNENTANGTVVGTVVASDPDAGDSLTYAITAGNTGGAFAINSSTGQITVASAAVLDFETNPSFALTVQVTDDGTPVLNDTATVTLTLADVNESPVVDDQGFALDENSANGTVVGTIVASDPDSGDSVTYAVIAGSGIGVFAVDSVTGQITVSDSSALDYETSPSFNLTVRVTDGALTDVATVTINLGDVNEAPSVVDQSFGVDENAANGTPVGTVASSDPDPGDALSTTITAGNEDGVFAIDNATGQITVADGSQLDYETRTTYTLTVQVADNGTPTLSDTATVVIHVNDINETPVVNDQGFGVDENSANGTVVGSVVANDPDAGDTLTYTIVTGNEAGAFAMDSATGEIRVNDSAALDFETAPTFSLIVHVSDGGYTDAATVTIDVNDVNEAPTVNDQGIGINENTSNGTVVGTAVASDPDTADTLTYAITAGNTGGAFAIDGATGQITVADSAVLDFETHPTFALTVQVADDGTPALSDTATVTLTLADVNESPGVDDQGFGVNENTANGTVVGSVVATDPDDDTLVYAITAGNTGGAFAIDGATGQITVADSGALDFETDPTFSLTVQASDGALSDTATVAISLADVNESPVVNNQGFGLNENAANGTIVGTVIASDPDTGDTLSYAITAGNTGGAFTINSATGQITVNNTAVLDFETLPSFDLTVEVTDDGTPSLSSTGTATITLADINDAPVVDDQGFAVDENSANGTVVSTVAALDPDAGDSLAFAITAGNTGGAFAIDSSTGQITVANVAALDFEANPIFGLTVRASDGALNSTATVTISLTDVNESPVIDDQGFGVDENSANGTVVGTVAASDPDAGDSLTYAITAGNTGGAFAIDGATGQITVANASALDFETHPIFALTVQGTDDGTPALDDTATVTITLADVNDAPVVDDQSFRVDENSTNGTVVGTVLASDPDAGDSLTYAITAGNDDGTFAIDPATGAITVSDGAMLDYEARLRFTLTVEVTDSSGQTDTGTITISLNDVDDTPPSTDASTGDGGSTADAAKALPFTLYLSNPKTTILSTLGLAAADWAGPLPPIAARSTDELFAREPGAWEELLLDEELLMAFQSSLGSGRGAVIASGDSGASGIVTSPSTQGDGQSSESTGEGHEPANPQTHAEHFPADNSGGEVVAAAGVKTPKPAAGQGSFGHTSSDVALNSDRVWEAMDSMKGDIVQMVQEEALVENLVLAAAGVAGVAASAAFVTRCLREGKLKAHARASSST